MVTLIKQAERVIAWDEASARHVYRSDCDVAFDESGILFVGEHYDGPAPKTQIDGRGLMAMPGMVSVHCHLNGGNLATGFLEEVLDPQFGHSPMYTRKGPFWRSAVATPAVDDGRWFKAAMRCGLGDLLSSGVTTVVDIQGATEAVDLWLDVLGESGIRAYLAPHFQEGFWRVRDGLVLDYEWDEKAGQDGLALALKNIAAAQAHASGRIDAMVFPAQVDTCREGLLREALAEARARGLMLQTHASQSRPEFAEIVRRSGLSPVQWLDKIDLLGPDVIVGHGIFLDHHSAVGWHTRKDLDILAASGASLAHCPLTFSRWGYCLEDFGRYRDAGITLAMGNDTGPHNMLEEIRCAFTAARAMSHDPASIAMSDVFHAATVGGAAALKRDDIGRLAPGAKADLVLVDLTLPQMRPGRDPLRNLVFVAADRAVRDVYVDGRLVLSGGQPAHFDWAEAGADLAQAQRRIIDEIKGLEGEVPPLDEIATLSLSD